MKIEAIVLNRTLKKVLEKLNTIQREAEEIKKILFKINKVTNFVLKETTSAEFDFAVSYLSPYISDKEIARLIDVDLEKYKEARKLISSHELQVENIFKLIGAKELIMQLAELYEAEHSVSLRRIKKRVEKMFEEVEELKVEVEEANILGIMKNLLDIDKKVWYNIDKTNDEKEVIDDEEREH